MMVVLPNYDIIVKPLQLVSWLIGSIDSFIQLRGAIYRNPSQFTI